MADLARLSHSRMRRQQWKKGEKERERNGILEGSVFGGCCLASSSGSGSPEVGVVHTECPVCCGFSRKYQEIESSLWQTWQESTTAEQAGSGGGSRKRNGIFVL